MTLIIHLVMGSDTIKSLWLCDVQGKVLYSSKKDNDDTYVIKDVFAEYVAKADELVVYSEVHVGFIATLGIDITEKKITIINEELHNALNLPGKKSELGIENYAGIIEADIDVKDDEQYPCLLAHFYRIINEKSLYLYTQKPLTSVATIDTTFKSEFKKIYTWLFGTDPVLYPKLNKEYLDRLFYINDEKIVFIPIDNNYQLRHRFKTDAEKILEGKNAVLYYGTIEYNRYPVDEIDYCMKQEIRKVFTGLADDMMLLVGVIKFDLKQGKRFLPRICFLFAKYR